jgi:hypothetical protein
MPLRLNVPEITAILAPCFVVMIVTRSASRRLRAVPACSIPARSNSSSVRFTPPKPRSRLWFDAVVHTSYPVTLIARTTCRGTANRGKLR